MSAMDDFLAVGTQMKIERPGKACAQLPVTSLRPMVILKDGTFKRYDSINEFKLIRDDVSTYGIMGN